MTPTTTEQLANILYNELTLEDLDKLQMDELRFLHDHLHHWAELTRHRIEKRRNVTQ